MFCLISTPLLAYPENVYAIDSTRQTLSNGSTIVQATDGQWYQESFPDEDGAVLEAIPLPIGGPIAQLGTEFLNYYAEWLAELNRSKKKPVAPVPPTAINVPDTSDIPEQIPKTGTYFYSDIHKTFYNGYPKPDDAPVSMESWEFIMYGNVTNLVYYPEYLQVAFKYTDRYIYNRLTGKMFTYHYDTSQSGYADVSSLEYWGEGGGSTTLHYQAKFSTTFHPRSSTSKLWNSNVSYIGFGSKDVLPESDPLNPDSPLYDPTIIDQYNKDYEDYLKKLKEYEYMVENDIYINKDYTTIDWTNMPDVKVDWSDMPPQDVDFNKFFDILAERTAWDDEVNDLSDFLNAVEYRLGINEYNYVPIDATVYDVALANILDGYAEVVALNSDTLDNDVTVNPDFFDDIILGDDGVVYRKDINEVHVLSYPLKLIRDFARMFEASPDTSDLVLPSVSVLGFDIIPETSFNMFDTAEEMGLSYLHSLYYVVTDAGLSLGVVYLARRKYEEFKEGRRS